MLDSRFYKNFKAMTIKEILDVSSLKTDPETNLDTVICNIATLHDAKQNDLSFFHNVRYKEDLKRTNATAVIVSPEFKDLCPKSTIALVSNFPLLDFVNVVDAMYPTDEFKTKISSLVKISNLAKLSSDCEIGDFVSIGDNVKIGNKVKIGNNVTIRDGVEIGDNTVIGDSVSISHAIIGKDVIINSGARIGESGFGILPTKTGLRYIKQLGRVIISDNVRIGANTTIDRGSINDTFIGKGTIIDNLVQIGHNVKIGEHSVIVSQVGISGSTEVGNGTTLAGQVGVAGHLKIGNNVTIAAKSGVTNDIPDGSIYGGFPAIDIKMWRKQVATLNIITKNRRKN